MFYFNSLLKILENEETNKQKNSFGLADFKIQYQFTRCMFGWAGGNFGATCDVQYNVKIFLVGKLHENQMLPPKGALLIG